MSEIRANILDHLTQHCTREASISSNTILDKFSKSHRLERSAVNLALDDLRHLGLIDISAGAVMLTQLAKRLLR